MKTILTICCIFLALACHSQVYILNEDFSTASGTTPPLNWQNNTIIGQPTDKWHFDNPGSRTINFPMTPPLAIFDASQVSPDTALEVASLETPYFDASIGSYTLLFFDQYFSAGNNASAKILAYNGTTWIDVATFTATTTTNPKSEVIDLTAICAGKTNAKLRFQWEGHGDGYWAVDNIRIYAPLFLDAGISAVNSPALPFNAGMQDVKVTLSNFGYQNISAATINWSINGVIQPPFSWNGSVPFGSSQPDIHIGSYNFPSATISHMKVWSEFPNGNPDPNKFNDSTVRALNAALCGTYTIGGTSPNFQTFNDAVAMITSTGITCPVIFKIRNGTYQEQVQITNIMGSSATNTVTFESESGDSSQVLLLSPGGEIPTIKLNGAKNLIFNKLGINNNFYGLGSILMDNNSENVMVTNCQIITTTNTRGIWIKNGASKISLIKNFFPAYGNNFMPKIEISNSNNVLIRGNKIRFNEIIVLGYAADAVSAYSGVNNLVINANEFYGSGSAAINVSLGNDTVEILNNFLQESSITVNSGLDNGLCRIEGNRINSSTSSGIILSSKNVTIANNYLSIKGNNLWHGIEANSSSQCKIVFNNINLLNNNINSRCLWLNGGNNIEIYNNILSNPSGGYSAYVTNSPASCAWNYNNYYNLFKRFGFLNDVTYQSFSAWATAINGEDEGLNINPFFSNDTVLAPHQILLNEAGIHVADVLYDIDSTLRNPTNPDIGAKEFSPCPLDAGINAVTAPVTPALPGIQDVKVILQNQGTSPLTSASISWSINGIMQTPLNWEGSIISAQNVELILGTFHFQSGTIYSIKAWTSNPNHGSDCDSFNDTAFSAKIYTKLCGDFTIGGVNPNFHTFNDAVSVLTNAGITCPVVFKVRNGIYPEQIEINPVEGSTAVNTVTFESESADSTQVLIWNQLPIVPTITINGAKNIIFKQLEVKKQGENSASPWNAFYIDLAAENILITNCRIITSYYTNGIQIGNEARKISIKNNFIYASPWSWGNGVIMAGVRDILVSGNRFRGYNLAVFGEADVSGNIRVSSNDVDGCGTTGIRFYSVNDSLSIIDNKMTASAINVSAYGNNIWTLVQGNRITTSVSSGIILSNQNCLVSNNNITITGITPWNGIEAVNCEQMQILYNSIHSINNNINSKCILIDGGNDIQIRNNIFSNAAGGYSAYVTNSPTTISWNYNDYYNPYQRTGFIGDSTYRSLSSWAAAINGEDHGVSANPFFLNDSIIVPNQILLNNVGIPVENVLYDIDSTLRNPANPDIGAKEFSPCTTDAGINALSAPVTPVTPGIQEVKVVLQNQGIEALISAKIDWSINGVIQTPHNWSGFLAYTQSAEIVLGTWDFQPGTVYHIKVWTSNPNNGIDCDPFNDTVFMENVYTKLCGTYTIGGTMPHFNTINDAVSVLTNAGITCPIIFKVRNGTYTEHLEFNPIPGSSTVNTVTFESESGDSSKVLVLYHGHEVPTITMNKAKNIILKKLGIKQLGVANVWGLGTFRIGNASENITVTNCRLITTQYQNSIDISSGAKDIMILRNFIHAESWTGGSGMVITNANVVSIRENKIQGFGWNAIYGNGLLSKMRINNNEVTDCGSKGFYFQNVSYDSLLFTGNTLTGSGINVDAGSTGGFCKIERNSVSNSLSSGIFLSSLNSQVTNNYIRISGNNIGNGIELSNCINAKITFNSINVSSSNVSSSKCVQINGGNFIEFKNNILLNSATGFCIYAPNFPGNTTWDYNNYYSTSNKIGFINGTAYATFPSWASAIGGEANGKNLNPFFASDYTYKLYQSGFNGAGIPIPGVLFDIEGVIRNNVAPDIGAWEFLVDFGITQVLHPTLACSHNPNDSLTIWIRQFGDVPFTNIKLAYKVNNGPVVYDTLVGSVFNDIMFTFKQRINITSQGDYTIKCWLVDNIDDNVSNDTITVVRYSYPSPVVDFSVMNACVGQSAQFAGTASIIPPYSIASFEWLFGDGDTSFVQNPTYTFLSAGFKSVNFKAYSNMGCYKDTTKAILIPAETVPTITGQTSFCQGMAGVIYQTESGFSNYTWTISPGGIITSGSGTNNITVTWVSAGNQWVRVNYENSGGCFAINPTQLNIDVSYGPQPTITGNSSVCLGTTGSVYYSQPMMIGYNWNVSPGGLITSGAGTNTITVTWNSVGVQTVDLIVTPPDACPPTSAPTLSVSVDLPSVVSVSITAGENPVCQGKQVTFTAAGSNVGSTPVYQWFVNGSAAGTNSATFTYVPVNNDIVTCSVTSNQNCVSGNPALSNSITMATDPPLQVSVSITASANQVCQGTVVTYSALPVNGGTNPQYQWKVNGANVGTNSSTLSYVPANGDAVHVVLSSNVPGSCISGNPANSNSITMAVIPLLPVSVSVAATANPVCAGSSVSFMATPVNPGTSPFYQWKVNGINAGSNSPNYTYAPVNGDVVTCQLASSETCISGSPAVSNPVTMIVSELLPVSISVAASQNPVCAGTQVVYTATPVNGGSVPVYQWKINGYNAGSGQSTLTYVPVNGDVVTCMLISDIACPSGNPATSNSIAMTVNPLLPVSVSITTQTTSVCSGQQVTLQATAINGGTSPGYQWKVNGNNMGINNPVFTFTPANGDVVTCQLTSSETCTTGSPATSNSITIVVIPLLPVSVSVAATANPVCAGSSVSFMATPVNPGTSPVYQWKVNGINAGSNSPSYTYTPINGDVVTCQLTSSETCISGSPATSNAISMNVNPVLPVSLIITTPVTALCQGQQVTVQATPVNGGTAPAYQWRLNGQNTGMNAPAFTFTPSNGDQVICILTSNADCGSGNPATSNLITFLVNPIPTPTISGSGESCVGSTGVAYSTQPGMSNYQWILSSGGMITSGSGTHSIQVAWNTNGIHTLSVHCTSAGGCQSQYPGQILVSVLDMPGQPGAISGDTAVCVGTGGVAYSVATVANATSYVWSLPFGVNIASGTGTNQVTVNFSNSAVSGNFSVYGTNRCFSGTVSQNYTVMANPQLVGNHVLQNIVIPPTHEECLAAQSITTAGNGSLFVVENGGEVKLIAAQFVKMLPGTMVHLGGYFRALITQQCIPCTLIKVMENDSLDNEENLSLFNSSDQLFTVYPNPTSGKFTIEMKGAAAQNAIIQVYNMTGNMVMRAEMTGLSKKEIHFGDQSNGIYLITVIDGERIGMGKIIKID